MAASLVAGDTMDRFHKVTEEPGLLVFTAFFIAPGFPHDFLCYVAGLTDIDVKKLAVSVSLGRLPTLLALVATATA